MPEGRRISILNGERNRRGWSCSFLCSTARKICSQHHMQKNPPQIAYALIALFVVLYLSLPQHLWENGLAANLQKAYTHSHLDDGKALAIFYPRCLQVAVRPQLTLLSAPSSSSYLPCVDFQHTGYLLLLFHCN